MSTLIRPHSRRRSSSQNVQNSSFDLINKKHYYNIAAVVVLALAVIVITISIVMQSANLSHTLSPRMTSADSRSRQSCGHSTAVKTQRRILGGVLVDSITDVPWLVYISTLREQGGVTRMCGGTLINTRWILTAARCLLNVSVVSSIIAGTANVRESTTELAPATWFIHPGYNYSLSSILNPDVALIKLEADVATSEKLHPICLQDDGSRGVYYDRCYIAGFGRTGDDEETPDGMLRAAQIGIQEKETCYNLTRGLYEDDRHFCSKASVEQAKACKGDSGGPVMCYQQGSRIWLQIGIVSNIIRPNNARACDNSVSSCCQDAIANVHTKVFYYLDWIHNTIAGN